MAAITYPTPTSKPAIEGIMLVELTICRVKRPCPTVKLVFSEGYYLKNGEEPVLNALGLPMWINEGRAWEIERPLNDPGLGAMLVSNELDLMTLDDKFAAVGNAVFDAAILNPPAPPAPMPVLTPEG